MNLEAIEAGTAGSHGLPSRERISALVDAMGAPQSAYPSVHVTGTNGKGSATRMVASILGAMGLRTGAYTSPHLERVNERITTADEPISDDDLAAQLAALAELERFLRIQPTWFELMTAAGLRYFADEAVEAAVVEVGLGGRYDATNVVDGQVSVITNVELDHTDLLGNSRELIAAEKAGIIKTGAVVVLGERDDEIADIFEKEASSVGAASVWRRGRDFGAENLRIALGGRVADLYTPAARYEDVFVPVRGAHQADNAAAALAATQAFVGDVLSDAVVREGMGAVRIPGRLEIVSRRPLVVLDGAHNAAGASAAGAALLEDFAGAAPVTLVFGCLRSHDPLDLLTAFPRERVGRVVTCTPPSPRGLTADAVAELARSAGFESSAGGEVADALETALAAAGEDELVLVTGSLYVVGAARAHLRHQKRA